MSFFKQIGEPYGLSEEQSSQLEIGLKELKRDFNPEFAAEFYQKFENLISEFGFDDGNVEALVSNLYDLDEYRGLVTYIIPSYYNAGGDRDMFEDTYQQMISAFQ